MRINYFSLTLNGSLHSGIEHISKRIPFISNHLTYPLSSTLRSYVINPALYNNTDLGSQLISNKIDKIECDDFYKDQTDCSFRKR